MCGICGIFRPDSQTVEHTRINAMRDVMFSRGPDAAGVSVGHGFGLGHRRLSIIDLSDMGRQPMGLPTRVEIVFNGEIYNFKELRDELTSAGAAFRSSSDTEVLLHGYLHWGIDKLVRRLRGMFAFALLDHEYQQIHLARDPLGKKPLFYHFDTDGELVFASSARALVRGLPRAPAIRTGAVDDLLWNLYIPGPDTVFEGVSKLQPGSYLTVDRSGKRDLQRYWRPDFMTHDESLNQSQWLERIDNSLRQAIRRRFVSDVPVGVLLSGGIDSGLIAALGAQETGELQTFSVATEDPALDESSMAAEVARMYNTRHTTLRVGDSQRANLLRLVQAMGEPFADASALNVQAIADVAQKSVKVVLTGDGGDEGFGGYGFFWAAYHATAWRQRLPLFMRPPVAALGRTLHGSGNRVLSRTGTFLNYVGGPAFQTFVGWLDEPLRTALFTSRAREELAARHPTDHYRRLLAAQDRSAPLVDRLMEAHIQTILPDDYCSKVDLATMSVSLEARSPFLDLDLFELAMQIPIRHRFAGGKPKALLRMLAQKYLPPATVTRPKLGFVTPVGRWLRSDWSDLVDRFVLGPNVEQRGWFNRATLQKVVAAQRAGKGHDYLIWSLLILELWLQMTVDGTLDSDTRI